MTSENSGIAKLNDKKLNQMKLAILKLEHENLRTRERANDEMIETIRKIIIDEVKKIY